jgi:outer membrane murein-binding lipoprotein Lpp
MWSDEAIPVGIRTLTLAFAGWLTSVTITPDALVAWVGATAMSLNAVLVLWGRVSSLRQGRTLEPYRAKIRELIEAVRRAEAARDDAIRRAEAEREELRRAAAEERAEANQRLQSRALECELLVAELRRLHHLYQEAQKAPQE